jgi:phage terminase large subunit-like protein
MSTHKEQVLRELERTVAARKFNKLAHWQPYERQNDFFALGAAKRERLFCAANQVGKSESAAFEMACHLTGLYPKWWEGKRFDHAIRAVAAGEGGLLVRDILQNKLLGTPGSDEDFGSGMIPRNVILGKTLGHGVSNLIDTVRVRHVTGGTSTLTFKTYEAGRSKFQGLTLDAVWLDEEPDAELYSEALARLKGDGILWLSFTPLKGYSGVVSRFLRDDSLEARRDRGVVRMGLKHAEHFTDEEKARRLAGYPAHERDARAEGIPMLGSGSVWEEVVPSDISSRITITDLPDYWPKLWGIDFGIAHPFAAVLTAWDRDADVFYVIDCFRLSGGVPAVHASRMNAIARGVPVAWPHDGSTREKGSGQTLASIYKREGLLMMPTHASFPDGSISTEGGIMEMLTRMRDGRFKVASHLLAGDWGDEFRLYHRKDGEIVKVNDDLMSATRIAVMARRYGKPVNVTGARWSKIVNPPMEQGSRIAKGWDFNPWTGRAWEPGERP